MNSFFIRILILASLVCMAITTVQAAEIYLDDDKLVIAGVDDSLGLGAFDVVLTYGNGVIIDSVDGLSGFMVVANVKNEEGIAVVAGVSTEGLTGTIPVATVKRSGIETINVAVRMLANTKGDPIAFTNPELSDSTSNQQPPPDSGKTTVIPITTSNSGGGAPTQTTMASQGQGQSETPVTAQTMGALGTPVTAKTTDAAKTEEPTPSGTQRTASSLAIAAVALLAVMVLKRKSY